MSCASAEILFLTEWRHKRLKNTIDLLLFYGEHFYGFAESDISNVPSGHRRRRLQDVLKRPWSLTTKRDVVTTSFRRRLIYHVSKTSDLCCLEDAQFWCLEDVSFTSPWRRPIYGVLKTSHLPRLEDVWFVMSWRRLIYDVLKTSNLRRFEDV